MIVVLSHEVAVEIGILVFLILLAWAALLWSRRCEQKDFDITQGLPLSVKELGQLSELRSHIHDCCFDSSQVELDEKAQTVRLRLEDPTCKTASGTPRAVLLTIGFVTSLSIQDDATNELYAVNEVEYYPGEERLLLTTHGPCFLEMKVTQLELTLQALTPSEKENEN